MPAPTISLFEAVVCRMGALITEKPMPTTSPHRVLPILSPLLLRPRLSGQQPGSHQRWQTDRIRTPFSLSEQKEMFGVFQTVAGATREGGTPLRVCPMSGLQGASGHSDSSLLHPSGTTPGGGRRPTTLPRLLRHRMSTRGRTTHPQLGGGRNRSGG